MCRKPECPHGGEKMCSCASIQSNDPLARVTHLFENIQEPKAELSYTTLVSPPPYRLCVSGTCGKCGGRLCIDLSEPGALSGDDFLAAVYRQMDQAFNAISCMDRKNFRQSFMGMFHERDQAAVRCWQKTLKGSEGGPCDA